MKLPVLPPSTGGSSHSFSLHPIDFKSMAMVQTYRPVRTLAMVLSIVVLTLFLLLLMVPWQQSVDGRGKVTVFSPMNRPQTITAQINARISQWTVQEGDKVKKGQKLLTLAEIEPKYLDPQYLPRLEGQRQAYMAKQKAIALGIQATESQISALSTGRSAVIPGAQTKVQQAQQKQKAAEQLLVSANQNYITAELNYKRRKELYDKGLRSKRDFELAEFDFVKAKADLEKAKADLTTAQMDVSVSGFDLGKDVSDATAKLSEAQAKLAKLHEEQALIQSELLKLDVEIQNLINRIDQRTVLSPIDGQVTRLMKLGAGETVKEGEELAVVVPYSKDQAVELFVADWNIPLISVGRKVRLQFAGWPALQFTGWPSVAVGTFAGKVKVIDAVDDGKNQYRLLVVPDTEAIEQGDDVPWPAPEHLRPGTQVLGWVMLDTVPLYYELWRQFNGFPPTVEPKSEKPKVPGIGPAKVNIGKEK